MPDIQSRIVVKLQALAMDVGDTLVKLWSFLYQYSLLCYQQFLNNNYEGRVLQMYVYNKNVRSMIRVYDYSNFFVLVFWWLYSLIYGKQSIDFNFFDVSHNIILVYDEDVMNVLMVVHNGQKKWLWTNNKTSHEDVQEMLVDERKSAVLYAELNDHIDFTHFIDEFLPNITRNTDVKCREFVDIALSVHGYRPINVNQLKVMTSDDFKEIVLKGTDQITFTNE